MSEVIILSARVLILEKDYNQFPLFKSMHRTPPDMASVGQFPAGVFTEKVLADSMNALAHVQVIDFNNDGLMNFVTGGMHAYPPFDRMGRVTLGMNNGKLPSKK